MIRRVDDDSALAFPLVSGRASRVKRSEMDFSCRRGGRMICTSGSRQRGSWILATEAGARTVTGMDCVIVVSLSRPNVGGAGPSAKETESSFRSPLGPLPGSEGRGGGSMDVVVGGRKDVRVLVRIVSERRGMLSFFVRRIEAPEAVRAERRARLRWARETWRFMVLLGVADWIM